MALYREKVLGCWLGKAVGGTLGGPAEGKDGPLSLTFYHPVPDRMLPNDDLDLQIAWMEALRRHGLPVDRHTLAQAWLAHIHLWPDEYGVACRNLTQGLYPPASGWFDNGFTAGMGAAIRTEIWACLAPGDPALAAALATEDACVDHAGEGLYAAQYLAALESAAFVEQDQETLLELAASTIPGDSRVARALSDTRDWWAETHDWLEVRERILAQHGRQNFTDVAQNLAFILLGWLTGGDDFGAAISTAVNCGRDTDCTGATLGALLGILNPQGIDDEWLEPIGRDLVLSPGMVGMHPGATLDTLTDQVTALAVEVLDYYGSEVRLGGEAAPPSGGENLSLPRHRHPKAIMAAPGAGSSWGLVMSNPLVVRVGYPPSVALSPGTPADLHVWITNPAERDIDVRLSVRAPDGWSLRGSEFAFHLVPGGTKNLGLTVTPPPAGAIRVYRNPLDLKLEVDGLRWVATAGMVTTIPWLHWPLEDMVQALPEPANGAEVREVAGHVQGVPEGPWAFASDFKLSYSGTVRAVIQAPRELRVWIDDEEVNHHDGSWRVPAFHRARETGSDVVRRRGWHRLTVAVGQGQGGELFVGLGDGETWDWLRDVEWRIPA
jgi:ADP-ribosylglycohydrolase